MRWELKNFGLDLSIILGSYEVVRGGECSVFLNVGGSLTEIRKAVT